MPVRTQTRWLSVREAASVLGFATVSFRRVIERHARRAHDGSIEARFDGIVARKCGRSWRVHLSAAWMTGRA